jgi:hypothetical protein
LAAFSVNSNNKRDVGCWHIADNPTAPEFVAYWTNNGQRPVLGLIG